MLPGCFEVRCVLLRAASVQNLYTTHPPTHPSNPAAGSTRWGRTTRWAPAARGSMAGLARPGRAGQGLGVGRGAPAGEGHGSSTSLELPPSSCSVMGAGGTAPPDFSVGVRTVQQRRRSAIPARVLTQACRATLRRTSTADPPLHTALALFHAGRTAEERQRRTHTRKPKANLHLTHALNKTACRAVRWRTSGGCAGRLGGSATSLTLPQVGGWVGGGVGCMLRVRVVGGASLG